MAKNSPRTGQGPRRPGPTASRDIQDEHAARFHRDRLSNALDGATQVPEKPGPSPSKPEERANPPLKTAGQLALDAGHQRRRHERAPEVDVAESLQDLAAALVSESHQTHEVQIRASHPDLPELEEAPPVLLSPLEAMRDVYMKTKGRASPKTQSLLESPDLDALIEALRPLALSEDLAVQAKARVRPEIFRVLYDDPGPTLTAMTDRRLSEPWRLFVEGWDIWDVTEERLDPYGDSVRPQRQAVGIELFLEGDLEDERGNLQPFVQSLGFVEGEVILTTSLGDLRDELLFDGEAFYRIDARRAGTLVTGAYEA